MSAQVAVEILLQLMVLVNALRIAF